MTAACAEEKRWALDRPIRLVRQSCDRGVCPPSPLMHVARGAWVLSEKREGRGKQTKGAGGEGRGGGGAGGRERRGEEWERRRRGEDGRRWEESGDGTRIPSVFLPIQLRPGPRTSPTSGSTCLVNNRMLPARPTKIALATKATKFFQGNTTLSCRDDTTCTGTSG